MIPVIVTIAGSDSGGGAGIQADLKSIAANGGFGASVVTAVTAQNTQEVVASMDLPPDMIEHQLRAVFSDLPVAAVKTGMLGSTNILRTVASFLRGAQAPSLVVDPVMVSKSGFRLLEENAILALREDLLPLALVVTPNRSEAEILSGVRVRNEADAREAGLRILEAGCKAVLIKGGHIDAFQSTDYLITARGCRAFAGERITTKTTHGTGCTYAAAIATWLALGLSLEDAVQRSKTYVTAAIRHGLAIGAGYGPTDHFWFLRGEGGKPWW